MGYEVVVIGSSTGGPRALTEVLGNLPEDLPAGLVVAQHIPAGFTRSLAERLDGRSRLTVREAQDGDEVSPGSALLCPGGRQITVERVDRKLRVRILDVPSTQLHRPSVDALFESVARTVGARAVGLVLTGMGCDGAIGLRCLQEVGAPTFAESEESAVIFGMPRAAAAPADHVLPLHEIAAGIARVVVSGSTSPSQAPRMWSDRR